MFPDKRIAVTSLRKLYLKHGVRKKKVRQEKVLPGRLRQDYAHRCQVLFEELDWARQEGRRVVFLDEINFTKRSLLLREYSGKNSNLSVDQREVYVGYRSVIATMSGEGGVGLIQICTEAIDADSFLRFLKRLRQKYGRQPLALFMDQLQVHRASSLRNWWGWLDIKPVYNVSYSPELNPIEAVFAKVKALFNRQRLNNLVNKVGFNMDREIEAAFRAVTPEHCRACVRKS